MTSPHGVCTTESQDVERNSTDQLRQTILVSSGQRRSHHNKPRRLCPPLCMILRRGNTPRMKEQFSRMKEQFSSICTSNFNSTRTLPLTFLYDLAKDKPWSYLEYTIIEYMKICYFLLFKTSDDLLPLSFSTQLADSCLSDELSTIAAKEIFFRSLLSNHLHRSTQIISCSTSSKIFLNFFPCADLGTRGDLIVVKNEQSHLGLYCHSTEQTLFPSSRPFLYYVFWFECE
jgi:hypothetical protein